MSNMYDDDANEETTPEDLCRRAFSRCGNWPEDRAGQLGLAQGLKLASDRYRVPEQDIIARCKEQSSFCPTDHDLLNVAADLFKIRADAFEAKRNKTAEWGREFGTAQIVPVALTGKCSCCGREWADILKHVREQRKGTS